MSKWWDKSWNTLVGCSRESAGCENCYAEKLTATRLRHLPFYKDVTTAGKWNGNVLQLEHKLDAPTHWRRPQRIFVNDMSDTFHPFVPFHFIAALYGVAAACPQHTFIFLTKRAWRMREFYEWIGSVGDHDPSPAMACGIHASNFGSSIDYLGIDAPWPLPNVHLGVTCEDKQRANERIPLLLQCPAVVRFISAEPMLEAVDFSRWLGSIHLIICGGESGPKARPCSRESLESIVRDCGRAGTPCFVKQLGSNYVDEQNGIGGRFTKQPDTIPPIRRLREFAGRDMAEWPESLRVRQYPEVKPCA